MVPAHARRSGSVKQFKFKFRLKFKFWLKFKFKFRLKFKFKFRLKFKFSQDARRSGSAKQKMGNLKL